MVTQFIKEKEVKENLNKLFKKPLIESFQLKMNTLDYNAPLVGNALDYFISCHFNYLKKDKTDSFVTNANSWIKKLKKNEIFREIIREKPFIIKEKSRSIKCRFIFINKKEIVNFMTKTKNLQDKLEKSYKLVTSIKKNGITSTQRSIIFCFEFPNKNKKQEFLSSKTRSWLEELKKIYLSETIKGKKSMERRVETTKYTPDQIFYICYMCNNQFRKYDSFFSSTYKISNRTSLNEEIIYCYTAMEISKLLEKSLIEYEDYKITGKVTDSFLKAILILAQILPGIQLRGLAKDMGNPSQNDMDMLNRLIKKVPRTVYEPKNVLINPRLGFGLITGEPDYIVDDLILDIKTTKELFRIQDYHQLLCYYLLYKTSEKEWNKEGVKINKIGIYYSLYGELIQFNIADLCSPKELKEAVTFIKQTKWTLS